jgi:uncharacterized protein YqhQ
MESPASPEVLKKIIGLEFPPIDAARSVELVQLMQQVMDSDPYKSIHFDGLLVAILSTLQQTLTQLEQRISALEAPK